MILQNLTLTYTKRPYIRRPYKRAALYPPCMAVTFKFSFKESDSAVAFPAALVAAETAAAAALATSMAAEMVLLPRLHRFFRMELSRRSLRPLVLVVVDKSSESDIWRQFQKV